MTLLPIPDEWDRYCLMACSEQTETGACACTRRMDREIKEAGPNYASATDEAVIFASSIGTEIAPEAL